MNGSLSCMVVTDVYFKMKICEGYATLQNDITEKETVWKIQVCIQEIPVPPGRKAAGFEGKMDGNEPPNSSVQPHEMSGNEGIMVKEGDMIGSWDMGGPSFYLWLSLHPLTPVVKAP